jgi:hypothetical protein
VKSWVQVPRNLTPLANECLALRRDRVIRRKTGFSPCRRMVVITTEEDLVELRRRINATRWPEKETVTLEGDASGAPHPEPAAYAKKFAGKYEHRTIEGGVGHNLPQEAPQAFAQAVIDVDGF